MMGRICGKESGVGERGVMDGGSLVVMKDLMNWCE